MRLFAALALALTTSLAAQTVETTEQTYGPFTPGPENAMALAAAPQGLLLVWSEIAPGTDLARIHTGLLGFDGRLNGEIHVLPATRSDLHAVAPAVTTDYDRFFIAWRERSAADNRGARVSGMILDRSGAPTGELYDFGAAVDGAPAVLWDGLTFRVYGNETYKIKPDDGTVTRSRGQAPRRVPFATPDMNGFVDWRSIEGDRRCVYAWTCSPVDLYSLSWSILTHTTSRFGGQWFSGYTSAAPAVVAEGKDLLIVWSTSRGLAGLRFHDGRKLGDPFTLKNVLAERTAPAMAGPLVVFAKDGNVYGSLVGEKSFGQPFPISADGEWDTLPRVYHVGTDRFLVTYVREHAPGSVSLVGRFVTVSS